MSKRIPKPSTAPCWFCGEDIDQKPGHSGRTRRYCDRSCRLAKLKQERWSSADIRDALRDHRRFISDLACDVVDGRAPFDSLRSAALHLRDLKHRLAQLEAA